MAHGMTFYNLLLHLYPASFRNEYGEEMRAVFSRRRRDVTSVLGLVALWLRSSNRLRPQRPDGNYQRTESEDGSQCRQS
jgi:hypothetical protein